MPLRGPENRRLAAVLVAAGRGERFGGDLPKQFQPLGGRPLYLHAAQVLHASALVDVLVVVVPPGWEERVRSGLAAAGLAAKLRSVRAGGATRQESVEHGLEAVGGADDVLVHDAVRPFLTPRLVRETVAAARRHGAATVALPVADTLVRAVAGEPCAAAIVPRDGVWSVQTPQVFDLGLLRAAHAQARARGIEATDDGRLVLELGRRLDLVPGSWWNIKVTGRADLDRAESILARRLGHGDDDEEAT